MVILFSFHRKTQIISPRKTFCQNLMRELETYCEKTTLHGLRYVGDPNLSFGER